MLQELATLTANQQRLEELLDAQDHQGKLSLTLLRWRTSKSDNTLIWVVHLDLKPSSARDDGHVHFCTA